jgi:DNA-binding transcriptional MerR regulator
MAHPLTIGQLARSAGMPAKTIRYYEEVGVLPPPSRTAAGYRQYFEESVERVRFLRRARALGVSLHHLKGLTDALDGRPRGVLRPRLLELIRAHLSDVQRRIGELELLQQQLEQVLHGLQAPPRRNPAGRCRCLETETPT